MAASIKEVARPYGCATSFVVAFVLALSSVNVVAVTTILVLHVGVIGHHVPCHYDFMFPRRAYNARLRARVQGGSGGPCPPGGGSGGAFGPPRDAGGFGGRHAPQLGTIFHYLPLFGPLFSIIFHYFPLFSTICSTIFHYFPLLTMAMMTKGFHSCVSKEDADKCVAGWIRLMNSLLKKFD